MTPKKTTHKVFAVAGLYFKEIIRNWQSVFWMLMFPTMITVIISLVFNQSIPHTTLHQFDYAFPGMAIYASGMIITNAAITFANEKKNGLLERFDTMPIGRKNIFLGGLLADTAFVIIAAVLIFVIGYVFIGVYYKDLASLFLGFAIAVTFGIQFAGLGILFAAFSKGPEAASGAATIISMMMIFLSGCFFPFESDVVYFMPPYWAKQIFLQISVFGDSLTDPMYSSSLIGDTATKLPIPLWGGLLIFIAMTVVFLVIGIIAFQKKTSF